MESLLTLKYLNNLVNLGAEGEKIRQLEVLRNKLVVLLEDNTLIYYDVKGDKKAKKKYQNIRFLTSFEDFLFILEESGNLIIVDSTNLEVVNTIELSDRPYYFCFFEDYKSFNVEILYSCAKTVSNEVVHEIVFYSKGYLFENKKSLCKEKTKIEKIDYQKGLLIWTTDMIIKILDLDKKVMLLRRSFQTVKKSSEGEINVGTSVPPNTSSSSRQDKTDLTMDFLYIIPYLILSIKSQILIIYKIDVNTKDKVTETYRFDGKMPLAGYWFNNSLSKLSLLQVNQRKDTYESSSLLSSLSFIESDLMQQNARISLTLEMVNIGTKESILSKNFNFIFSYSPLSVCYSHKHSIVYIHNGIEIYVVAFQDKKAIIFQDLRKNEFNFDMINESFPKFLKEEKFFIASKIVSNLKQLSKIKNNEKHIVFILSSIMDENTFFLLTDQMINRNNLHFGFYLVKKFMKYCSTSDVKKKIVMYFLMKSNLNLLTEFIQEADLSNLDDSEDLEHMFSDIIINSIDEKKYDLYCCFSAFYMKTNFLEKALECLIKIKHKESIFKLLIDNSVEELIITYCDILTILTQQDIVTLISNISEKIGKGALTKDHIDRLFILLDSKYKQILVSVLGVLVEKSQSFNLIPKFFIRKTIDYLINEDQVFYSLVKNLKENDDLLYIVSTYKEKLDKNKNYWDSLILVYFKIGSFKKILDIYIEKMKDPEKAVNFIESLSSNSYDDYPAMKDLNKSLHLASNPEILSNNNKSFLYEYLQEIIKNSTWLSSAKKFYFINLFHDVFSKDNQILTEENLENDDLKFILLIFEQLQLKTKILEVTLDISKKNLGNALEKSRRARTKGTLANLELKLVCDLCKVQLSKYDKVFIFVYCLHCFHDYCFNSNSREVSKKNIKDDDLSIELNESIDENACKMCLRTE